MVFAIHPTILSIQLSLIDHALILLSINIDRKTSFLWENNGKWTFLVFNETDTMDAVFDADYDFDMEMLEKLPLSSVGVLFYPKLNFVQKIWKSRQWGSF